jgi:small neutral amino acid transporter SnatA (MarC family)
MHKHAWTRKTFAKHEAKQKRGGGHVLLWMFGIAVGASMFEGGIALAVSAVDGIKGLVRRAQGHGPEELGFERLADSQQDSLYAVP